MVTRLCCFQIVEQKEQLILHDFTERSLVDGPRCCVFVAPWIQVEKRMMVQLNLNQYALIICDLFPENNRYEFGPCVVKLRGPFENIAKVDDCPVLDQDDYIVVCGADGIKRNFKGPGVFKPQFGDTWNASKNTIQVPVNCYMIVNDANNPDHPVHHVRGPLKFFPEPFQTITLNGKMDYFPCIEVTQGKGIHLQKADGNVVLLDQPQFYMPLVGEKVVKEVERTVLLLTDFCILKGPDGRIRTMKGRIPEERSFFLEPFNEFLIFQCDVPRRILSTLPTFMSHDFCIRTSDNVQLQLDVRISFQIQNVDIFSANPVDFYPLLRNHIQNEMLDKFSQATIREFMSTFAKIAQQTIPGCSSYFLQFGIEVLDIQVLNYTCTSKNTQELLETDIHTNVTKQNELRMRQNDVLIQEQISEVQRKQKDLEVQMALKDNEVALQKKQLDNSIRLKDMEISILEEHKRKELLEVRRGNDLVEAEFEGRSRGQLFNEFVQGIDAKLTPENKMSIWMRQMDLEQARLLYSKVQSVTMYPPNADLKLFNFNGGAPPSSQSTGFESLGSKEYESHKDSLTSGLLFGVGAFEPHASGPSNNGHR